MIGYSLENMKCRCVFAHFKKSRNGEIILCDSFNGRVDISEGMILQDIYVRKREVCPATRFYLNASGESKSFINFKKINQCCERIPREYEKICH